MTTSPLYQNPIAHFFALGTPISSIAHAIGKHVATKGASELHNLPSVAMTALHASSRPAFAATLPAVTLLTLADTAINKVLSYGFNKYCGRISFVLSSALTVGVCSAIGWNLGETVGAIAAIGTMRAALHTAAPYFTLSATNEVKQMIQYQVATLDLQTIAATAVADAAQKFDYNHTAATAIAEAVQAAHIPVIVQQEVNTANWTVPAKTAMQNAIHTPEIQTELAKAVQAAAYAHRAHQSDPTGSAYTSQVISSFSAPGQQMDSAIAPTLSAVPSYVSAVYHTPPRPTGNHPVAAKLAQGPSHLVAAPSVPTTPPRPDAAPVQEPQAPTTPPRPVGARSGFGTSPVGGTSALAAAAAAIGAKKTQLPPSPVKIRQEGAISAALESTNPHQVVAALKSLEGTLDLTTVQDLKSHLVDLFYAAVTDPENSSHQVRVAMTEADADWNTWATENPYLAQAYSDAATRLERENNSEVSHVEAAAATPAQEAASPVVVATDAAPVQEAALPVVMASVATSAQEAIPPVVVVAPAPPTQQAEEYDEGSGSVSGSGTSGEG